MNDLVKLLLMLIYIVIFSLNFARGVRLMEKRNKFSFLNSSAINLVPISMALAFQNLFTLISLFFETSLMEINFLVNGLFLHNIMFFTLLIR